LHFVFATAAGHESTFLAEAYVTATSKRDEREIREDFQEIVHKAEVGSKEMCAGVEIFNRGEMKRRNRKE
jgi:hypothetical protein